MPSETQIKSMFNNIAHRYDLLNNILSLGTHWLWKRKLVALIREEKPKSLLDGATGTGDIANLCYQFCLNVTGIDISQNMLNVAKARYPHIEFKSDNLCNLDIKENSYDVSTVSFGVRNVEDLPGCFSELSRVTRKKSFILEFGTPQNQLFKKIYFKVMRLFIPIIGSLLSNKGAYEYLIESSEKFPSADKFLDIARPYFKKTKYIPLWGGIVYIYVLEKAS